MAVVDLELQHWVPPPGCRRPLACCWCTRLLRFGNRTLRPHRDWDPPGLPTPTAGPVSGDVHRDRPPAAARLALDPGLVGSLSQLAAAPRAAGNPCVLLPAAPHPAAPPAPTRRGGLGAGSPRSACRGPCPQDPLDCLFGHGPHRAHWLIVDADQGVADGLQQGDVLLAGHSLTHRFLLSGAGGALLSAVPRTSVLRKPAAAVIASPPLMAQSAAKVSCRRARVGVDCGDAGRQRRARGPRPARSGRAGGLAG